MGGTVLITCSTRQGNAKLIRAGRAVAGGSTHRASKSDTRTQTESAAAVGQGALPGIRYTFGRAVLLRMERPAGSCDRGCGTDEPRRRGGRGGRREGAKAWRRRRPPPLPLKKKGVPAPGCGLGSYGEWNRGLPDMCERRTESGEPACPAPAPGSAARAADIPRGSEAAAAGTGRRGPPSPPSAARRHAHAAAAAEARGASSRTAAPRATTSSCCT
mmetsp:Transcript_10852/g.25788  ORF Transcript_10852/g.25788 Transcript_10852/m.25788 type:complete len:216 (+) Transcript_10852:108-755(+)